EGHCQRAPGDDPGEGFGSVGEGRTRGERTPFVGLRLPRRPDQPLELPGAVVGDLRGAAPIPRQGDELGGYGPGVPGEDGDRLPWGRVRVAAGGRAPRHRERLAGTVPDRGVELAGG